MSNRMTKLNMELYKENLLKLFTNLHNENVDIVNNVIPSEVKDLKYWFDDEYAVFYDKSFTFEKLETMSKDQLIHLVMNLQFYVDCMDEERENLDDGTYEMEEEQ